MTIRLNGSTSGYTEIDAAAVADNGVLSLPTGTGTLATQAYVDTAETDAIAGSGLVHINTTTFSAVSSVSVDDCFSATYDNYAIYFATLSNSVSNDIRLRWRVAGADNSTANYRYMSQQNGTNASALAVGATGATFIRIGYFTTGRRNLLTGVDVLTPFLSNQTGTFNSAVDESTPTAYATITTSVFAADTSFDGFTIYPTSGTITGTIRVYGYKNGA